MDRKLSGTNQAKLTAGRLLSRYGMLVVLLLLCAAVSLLTLGPQPRSGASAAGPAVGRLLKAGLGRRPVLVVARDGEEGRRFAAACAERIRAAGLEAPQVVLGEPAEARRALESLAGARGAAPALLTLDSFAPVLGEILRDLPALAGAAVVTPPPFRWPTFLLKDNLFNVASQIAVIAILAVGMTLVILTGGIDLSVGSLIALSAVVAATVIGRLGGTGASAAAMTAGGLAAIAACGASGAFSALVITRFAVPPFIATLGMMQVASGLAYIVSRGRPVYELPEGFVALGRGAEPILGIPWAVLVMAGIYAAAHVLMTRTTLGRYVYAVGGNAEAARLAGVRVRAVLAFAYVACGLLAGLGGVLMASQLRSGAPTYGLMYELYVIAAVVVGGTSLSGGEGRISGTLVGALIIAVIQNGMNLTGVESYTQKVILGLVILGAVLLDRLRRRE